MCTCMYVYVCVCMCMHMYVYVCVCMHACMHVCVCVRVCMCSSANSSPVSVCYGGMDEMDGTDGIG